MRDHAIRIHHHGGPDVLRDEPIVVGDPGPGEVRVRHTQVGVNFIDTYHRSGLYPLPLPSGLGLEAAGVIEAAGADVAAFDPRLRPGARVVYAMGAPGAYATARVMDAATVVPLPDDVSDEAAASSFLKGLTAEFLVRRCYPIAEGDAVLVHAAAGGVGLLLCQWARHLGATVIGTVGSAEKAALAQAHGAEHVILYDREDFVARTRELTGGEGVAVAYDGVGAATFDGSLRCLRPLGMMVSFGNASGPPPAVAPHRLAELGSLFLTRPTLATYSRARVDLVSMAEALFAVLASGVVRATIGQTFPLAEARRAHEALEARETHGATLLDPG